MYGPSSVARDPKLLAYPLLKQNMSSLPFGKGIIPYGSDSPERPFALVSGPHEDTRYMMRLMLEVWGFNVAEADGCDECVAIAAQRKPCLVLVDAAIPFDESMETVELLKRQSGTSDVPILMISGFGQDGYRQAALLGGVSHYMVKPVDFDELQRFVTHIARVTGQADENTIL